jgi:cytidylate kinase
MNPAAVEPAPVVCVDGPSGAGKGTITQLLAQRLGYRLLDSGALYRVTALSASRQGVDLTDEPALVRTALNLAVRFEPTPPGEPARVLLDNEDVTAEIRTETCGDGASRVAVIPAVRQALLQLQRDFRQSPGLVADGRDMGTVVFPEADVKVFLTASAEERAQRRYRQLLDAGYDVKISDLLNEIKARDERDMNRATAPLKPAEDAQVVDTTGLGIEEVLERVLALVGRR